MAQPRDVRVWETTAVLLLRVTRGGAITANYLYYTGTSA